VMSMEEAVSYGDIFLTMTGNCDVITEKHMKKMKNGAILANGGHFDTEINKTDLKKLSETHVKVRENVDEFILKDGRKLYLLAEGQLVNISAADGNPVEIMDMTFSTQALSLEYMNKNSERVGNQVSIVPKEIDEEVAQIKLDSLEIKIDSLTERQKEYLKSWNV